ncbi:MAG: Mating-type protein MAT alpha 1 [Aureobasidium pullulans]|nr:MAG: Mating-type protein MAT alpha 1 [Aureobasidium pullulans]
MRASTFFAAPLVAMAAAQSASTNETSVLSTIPISSSVPYTNGFTSFLTQTNSLGVVTARPRWYRTRHRHHPHLRQRDRR